jgi:hypothetical protein
VVGVAVIHTGPANLLDGHDGVGQDRCATRDRAPEETLYGIANASRNAGRGGEKTGGEGVALPNGWAGQEGRPICGEEATP